MRVIITTEIRSKQKRFRIRILCNEAPLLLKIKAIDIYNTYFLNLIKCLIEVRNDYGINSPCTAF